MSSALPIPRRRQRSHILWTEGLMTFTCSYVLSKSLWFVGFPKFWQFSGFPGIIIFQFWQIVAHNLIKLKILGFPQLLSIFSSQKNVKCFKFEDCLGEWSSRDRVFLGGGVGWPPITIKDCSSVREEKMEKIRASCWIISHNTRIEHFATIIRFSQENVLGFENSNTVYIHIPVSFLCLKVYILDACMWKNISKQSAG